MTAVDRAELEGVGAERSPQTAAGALVAEASMRALSREAENGPPQSLRDGVILRELDGEAAVVETPVDRRGNRR
ncbi:hypothetical protein MCHIJ_03410 [Mycolicibacterium chitae]|nr:hypothetical protein [Mycolicibacterium chitae]BBZ00904.1 hypothetical protein MCHIJ_03410 [Mycolicibacterium chitae]